MSSVGQVVVELGARTGYNSMVAKGAGLKVAVVAIGAHSSAVLPVCQTVAKKFHPLIFAFSVQPLFGRVEVFCPFVASLCCIAQITNDLDD